VSQSASRAQCSTKRGRTGGGPISTGSALRAALLTGLVLHGSVGAKLKPLRAIVEEQAHDRPHSNKRQTQLRNVALHMTPSDKTSRSVSKLRKIDEIAERWEVSPRTVQRQIESGALRSHRIGRLRRISDADAEDFLKKNRDD
jgi:excisionase family DNA binding protein